MAVRDKERRLLTPDRKGEVGQTQPLFYGPRSITSKESSPNNEKLDSHGSARKRLGEASVGPRHLCLEEGTLASWLSENHGPKSGLSVFSASRRASLCSG